MKINVVTLFPDMITNISEYGIVRRAKEKEIISLDTTNPRDFTSDNYKKVDDRPYGGGPGMVMKYEPLKKAIKSAKSNLTDNSHVILLSPQGVKYDQKIARRLSTLSDIILVSGRYEGIDQRLIDKHIDEEISLGDYILSGGEIAAMSVIDSIVRLLPGSLGDNESSKDESFEDGLLEYPHYTRPEMVDGMKCPEILLSGNHKAIKQWRKKQSMISTSRNRPDLLKKFSKD